MCRMASGSSKAISWSSSSVSPLIVYTVPAAPMNASSPSPGTVWSEIPRSVPLGPGLPAPDVSGESPVEPLDDGSGESPGPTLGLGPWSARRKARVEVKSAAPPGDTIVRLTLSPTGLLGESRVQAQPVLVLLSVLGMASFYAVAWAERKLCPWYMPVENEGPVA